MRSAERPKRQRLSRAISASELGDGLVAPEQQALECFDIIGQRSRCF